MNIFKGLNDAHTVFKNEHVFFPDFIPTEIFHREKEIKDIAFVVAPIIQGRRISSIVLYGPPGTGKTTIAKHILNQINEATMRVKSIFINCAKHNYRYSMLSEILSSLDYAISRRGRSADELLSYIVEILKKENKSLLIVLDDLDMSMEKERNHLLYDLLRMQENFGIKCGLIAITNREEIILKLDERVRSSLLQTIIKFQPYSAKQIKDILNERAKLGFFDNVYDEDVIGLCAGFGTKNNGDGRLAINTLWLAGKQADKENSEKITVEHVEKIKKASQEFLRSEQEKILSKEERMILDELRKAEYIQSGALYSRLKLNERSVRNYLTKLEELGFIEATQLNLKEGKTRIFSIKK